MRDASSATCPICEASCAIPEGTEVHELLPCSDCGTDLEVESVAPVKLVPAPEIEEDWGE